MVLSRARQVLCACFVIFLTHPNFFGNNVFCLEECGHDDGYGNIYTPQKQYDWSHDDFGTIHTKAGRIYVDYCWYKPTCADDRKNWVGKTIHKKDEVKGSYAHVSCGRGETTDTWKEMTEHKFLDNCCIDGHSKKEM